MQKTILVMLSGGVDSCYMLYYYLTQTDYAIHAHHISLRYPSEPRWEQEDIACHHIVEYCRRIRPFEYTVNNFTTVNKFSINNRTLDIRNLSAIELRNAVSHIDSVSFLLSEINIRVGEKLDMGSYGIYTVKSGDTLSEIAQTHSKTTKDLVQLNTWLIDDNRIKFNYLTKVLIDTNTTLSSVINHSMAGSMQDELEMKVA